MTQFTQAEQEKALFHLFYEMKMFQSLVHCHWPAPDGKKKSIDGVGNFVHNALVESAITHFRSVVDFFRDNGGDDDLRFYRFLINSKANPLQATQWTQLAQTNVAGTVRENGHAPNLNIFHRMTQNGETWHSRACKHVCHLSLSRVGNILDADDKIWKADLLSLYNALRSHVFIYLNHTDVNLWGYKFPSEDEVNVKLSFQNNL